MSPGGLRVRPAVREDLSSIVDIDLLVSQGDRRERRFTDMVLGRGQSGRVLVALADKAVCGFLAYQLVLDCATILDVIVHPDSRRRGTATALMKTAIDEMRSTGAARCELEVRVSNIGAIALYDAFNFSRDGVRADYYPLEQGREDGLLMSLEL